MSTIKIKSTYDKSIKERSEKLKIYLSSPSFEEDDSGFWDAKMGFINGWDARDKLGDEEKNEIEMAVISGHEEAIKELMDKNTKMNEVLKLAVETLEKIASPLGPHPDVCSLARSMEDAAQATLAEIRRSKK